LRDGLLIKSLKLPLTLEGAFAIMQGFSFEWVAEKSAFREANGLAHLLHMFHAFPSERDLQVGIGCVLRNVLCTSEENRKAVSRLIDEPDIAKYFFPGGGGVGGQRSTDTSPRTLDHEDVDPSEESVRVMSSFLKW
jgi:hypothetical protein